MYCYHIIGSVVIFVLLDDKSVRITNILHTDIDECRSSVLHACVHARCANTNGSFMCICNRGFMSDGNNGCPGKYL